ncbi:AEC family transporter [Tropicimonas sp. TH_r6]|uniref:AEC family transporter n=1 Tax=Tropicimonas sp. TH_r6 TaxID=3082085 RepID=UPI002955AE44|nr:AEC family transporter [Tropicimonas sp. TH_r6]MDV7143889.1 AEC family transporter [Tropicimonas sp. TH_r6]
MLTQMFEILGPIVIITAIGYLLGRSSVGLDTRALSSMVLLVATPALIFHTLTSLHVTPDTIRTMAGAALMCITLTGVMGLAILLSVGGPVRSFLPPLMLPNSGNMGLPLVLLAFGTEGLQLGVAYFFVVALVQHSVGLSIYAGSLRLSAILKQPLIYAVAAVLLVTWTGLPVPEIVLVTTELLGGMMVPAMLMLLGASLASLQVTDLRPALLVAFARLSLGVISALTVIFLLGLEGITAGVVFLLATMPTAIVNYIYAERFQHNPRQVAGSIVTSTIVTFVCLPMLVWTALGISESDDESARHSVLPVTSERQGVALEASWQIDKDR